MTNEQYIKRRGGLSNQWNQVHRVGAGEGYSKSIRVCTKGRGHKVRTYYMGDPMLKLFVIIIVY